jgi:hypothetical protein
MSGFNDSQIAALLQAETVHCATLVWFDFKSEPMWLWDGAYPLITSDGQIWQGIIANNGAISLSISGLERIADDVSNAVSFVLSGVSSSSLSLAREAGEEVTGRACRIYIQFFGDGGLVGEPILVNALIMDLIKISMTGSQERKLELTAENIFASKRRRPVNSLYTHRDQQGRFAGDKGFEYVPSMVQHTVKWPNF